MSGKEPSPPEKGILIVGFTEKLCFLRRPKKTRWDTRDGLRSPQSQAGRCRAPNVHSPGKVLRRR